MDRSRFNPFPGLRSFEPDEDFLFFGRDTQVGELLARLQHTRFLGVVGGSGSGKSSLVKSGLIPALHGGFMTKVGSSWRVALCRPGLNPTYNLAVALLHEDALGGDPGTDPHREFFLDATLRRSGQGLVSAVQEAHLPAGENLLVVVDQFDELFRFKRIRSDVGGRDEAVNFVRLLLEAAQHPDMHVYVVLTMRSEFIGNCAEMPGLAEAVNTGQYLVPRMTRDELRLAITGPVAVGSGTIAPRLVTRLLNEISDNADQLPVLQHALLRTWNSWEQHHAASLPIDVEDYEQIGTMRHALSRHAEEAFEEVDGADRPLVEKVFKALTETAGQGLGLRRPCTLRELGRICSEEDHAHEKAAEVASKQADVARRQAEVERVTRVVAPFRRMGRTFLLPSEGTPLAPDTVLDLSHESLTRLWTRLVEWTGDEGRWAAIYRRLSETAALRASGTGAELYRGVDLDAALQWFETQRPTEAWARRYDTNFAGAIAFLEASRRARDEEVAARAAEAAEKEASRLREIEAREQLAEEKERSRQQKVRALRVAQWVTGAFILGAAVLLSYAGVKKREADRAKAVAASAEAVAADAEARARQERRIADSATLDAKGARKRAERDSTKAVAALAAESLANAGAEAARKVAARDSAKADTAKRVAADAIVAAKIATDSAVAAGLRASKATAQAKIDSAAAAVLEQRALSRNLAAKARGVWSADDRHVPALLARVAYDTFPRNQGNPERDPNLDAALRAGLGAIDTGFVKRWANHKGGVRAISVLPPGAAYAGQDTLLVTGADDGLVRVFRWKTSVRTTDSLDAGSPIRSVALDPTGRWLAAGTEDGNVRLWKRGEFEKKKGATPTILAGQVGRVIGLDFGGPGLLVWAGPQGVRSVAFDSTGRALLPKPVRLDAVTTRRLSKDSVHIRSFALNRDAVHFVVGLDDGRVTDGTLDPSAGPALPPSDAVCRGASTTTFAVTAVAYMPKSRRVAVGCADGAVRLLRVAGAETSRPTKVHGAAVTGIAAAGGIVATSSLDGTVLLWNIESSADSVDFGGERVRLSNHKRAAQDSWVWAVALSQTGDRVFSASEDRTVQAQTTSVKAMADQVCTRLKTMAKPTLTPEEWQEHVVGNARTSTERVIRVPVKVCQ